MEPNECGSGPGPCTILRGDVTDHRPVLGARAHIVEPSGHCRGAGHRASQVWPRQYRKGRNSPTDPDEVSHGSVEARAATALRGREQLSFRRISVVPPHRSRLRSPPFVGIIGRIGYLSWCREPAGRHGRRVARARVVREPVEPALGPGLIVTGRSRSPASPPRPLTCVEMNSGHRSGQLRAASVNLPFAWIFGSGLRCRSRRLLT